MFSNTRVVTEDITHLYEGDTSYTLGFGFGFTFGEEYNYQYGDGCGKGYSTGAPIGRYPIELIQYW